jgi:O-acetyl-ADP-ribose deacetylase (regulator of RNase III)
MNSVATWNSCEICLHQGDITELKVDAIVNAANQHLLVGGGVCGVIHRKGGPAIARECQQIVAARGPLAVGEAAATTGGNLPARFVIHAIGPVYGDDPGRAAELLGHAYRNSLAVARDRGCRSIAIPCISTGIFGYPPDQACPVALKAVRDDLLSHGGLDRVIFCTFSGSDFEIYSDALGVLGGHLT